MSEDMVEEIGKVFPEKALLTIEDICKSLECDMQTVYNWNKRQSPKRRPPRILVGKAIRFPKRLFVLWFLQEQGRVV